MSAPSLQLRTDRAVEDQDLAKVETVEELGPAHLIILARVELEVPWQNARPPTTQPAELPAKAIARAVRFDAA